MNEVCSVGDVLTFFVVVIIVGVAVKLSVVKVDALSTF